MREGSCGELADIRDLGQAQRGHAAGETTRSRCGLEELSTRFRDLAELPCGPGTRVYEPGWQPWSPTGAYPATSTSPRPTAPVRMTKGCRPGKPAPATGFQGEGLLAVDPGDGGPVRLWASPDPDPEVAARRNAALQTHSARGRRRHR